MKALLTNAISTRNQFSAGGSQVPIITRASGSAVNGVQTFGLPMNNKTTLGAYRMGDSDGNAPPSAIFPNDIFSPLPARDRQYQQITFENIGNSVFQPEDTDAKLGSLLRALGDQKQKYDANAPFADYFATARLARETDEAARNAGLEDLGHAREIMRNLVSSRRKQNEDDYLRKMIDSGASLEDAQNEIDSVRKANALQEAKKVDDRTYQAKILIQRIANSRGITSSAKEPLTHSGAIENPQPDQQMAALMGQKDTAFGSSPLDTQRQFMTPEFYKRMLRRSKLTQEGADEQTAVNNLIAEGQIGNAMTLPMIQAQEREAAIENARDAVASRLERLRLRGRKLKANIPPVVFGDEVLGPFLRGLETRPGNSTTFLLDDVQTMNTLQLFWSIDVNLAKGGSEAGRNFFQYLQTKTLERGNKPVDNIRDVLREAALTLNEGKTNQYIPYSSRTLIIEPEKILLALNKYKTLDAGDILLLNNAEREYAASWDEAFGNIPSGVTAAEQEANLGPRERQRAQLIAGATLATDLLVPVSTRRLVASAMTTDIPSLTISDVDGSNAAGGGPRMGGGAAAGSRAPARAPTLLELALAQSRSGSQVMGGGRSSAVSDAFSREPTRRFVMDPTEAVQNLASRRDVLGNKPPPAPGTRVVRRSDTGALQTKIAGGGEAATKIQSFVRRVAARTAPAAVLPDYNSMNKTELVGLLRAAGLRANMSESKTNLILRLSNPPG